MVRSSEPEQVAVPGRCPEPRVKMPDRGTCLGVSWSAVQGAGNQIVAARLQEFFGCRETPRLCGEPVLLHLLSPAGRPVQITRDLGGFWERSYPEVKKELRGRYPKHPWPDDPLAAEPTARAKPRKR